MELSNPIHGADSLPNTRRLTTDIAYNPQPYPSRHHLPFNPENRENFKDARLLTLMNSGPYPGCGGATNEYAGGEDVRCQSRSTYGHQYEYPREDCNSELRLTLVDDEILAHFCVEFPRMDPSVLIDEDK